MAPQPGLDNSDWIRIGRTQCAQRVSAMDGANQPGPWGESAVFLTAYYKDMGDLRIF